MTLPRFRMLRVRRYTAFRIAMHLRWRATDFSMPRSRPAIFLRWLP